MWNKGATVTVRSPSRSPRPALNPLITFHNRLSWVNIAPFGRPVVPEVYRKTAEVAADYLDTERLKARY